MTQDQMVLIPLWYAMFLLSVTCHEAAHAFAAHRGGDPTAYLGGQVTLNPVPHVRREPFGTVVVPLIPWSAAGVFVAATLDVPTLSYLPWAVMNYTGFCFAIFYGFTGISIARRVREDETLPGS